MSATLQHTDRIDPEQKARYNFLHNQEPPP
jgi:hypothetical protein